MSLLYGALHEKLAAVALKDRTGPSVNSRLLSESSAKAGRNLVPSVACTGGGHIVGVDPITNYVYVPVSQYPADPNSSTTGVNGVLVFRDNTPSAQAPVTQASTTLAAIPGSGGMAVGTVQFTLTGAWLHKRLCVSPWPPSTWRTTQGGFSARI